MCITWILVEIQVHAAVCGFVYPKSACRNDLYESIFAMLLVVLEFFEFEKKDHS